MNPTQGPAWAMPREPGPRRQHSRFLVSARSVSAIIAVLCAVAVLSIACSRGEPTIPPPPFEGREHGDYPTLVPEGDEAEYRIGVGDRLWVHVQRHDEFQGEVKVGPSGKIILPLTLDRIEVAGLTTAEAENRVAETIRPYVKQMPRVWVEIKQPDSRFVYVLGAVENPGKLPIREERIYVREAVARAGWPLRTAALKRTKLISSTPESRAERRIDLKALLEGDLTENYEMKPGDVVWVPRTYASEFAYHGRQILEPFAVLLGMDRTLTGVSGIPTVGNTTGGK